MTFEEWADRGRVLAADMTDIRFQIGDWVNAGLDAFGIKAVHSVSEEIGWTKGTVRVYSWVASCYPVEHRRYRVPHSLYMVAAGVEAPARFELMARAERERLGYRELKQLLCELKPERHRNDLRANDNVVIVQCASADIARRIALAIESTGWHGVNGVVTKILTEKPEFKA